MMASCRHAVVLHPPAQILITSYLQIKCSGDATRDLACANSTAETSFVERFALKRPSVEVTTERRYLFDDALDQPSTA